MHYFQKYGEEARFISLVFELFAQQIIQALAYIICQVKLCLNIVRAIQQAYSRMNIPLEIETRMLYNHSNIQGICL